MRTPFTPLILFAALALSASAASAGVPVPTTDTKGLSDPPGLKRYAGAVLIYRDDVGYDEIAFPRSPLKSGPGSGYVVDQALRRAGQRTALQYIAPAGRSGLEVLRNYQQELKAAGYETVYECAGKEQCGGSSDGFDYTVLKHVMPASWKGKAGNDSPMACSAASASNLRYALLDNKTSGASVAVVTYTPYLTSGNCDEKAYQQHYGVTVVRVEPKAREQKMVTLSASELSQSLTANGKVAIYGIYFDFNKANIKPESRPSLEQIGALLKQQPALKLHVVGHTDNVGSLPANLELSRQRAQAVAAALGKDYGIAAARLTANGVANLAPVASNASEEGRAKNRRVELVLQ